MDINPYEEIRKLLAFVLVVFLYTGLACIVMYLIFFKGASTENVLASAAVVMLFIATWFKVKTGDSEPTSKPMGAATVMPSDAAAATRGGANGSNGAPP